MKPIKVIISFIISLNFCFSEDKPDYSFWKILDENEKITFVKGYYLGLSRSLNTLKYEAARMRRQDKFWSPPFSHENSAKIMLEFFSDPMPSYSEIVEMVDALYESSDNHKILIETSLHILMLHRSGSETKANALLLREQRKVLKGR